MRIFEIKDLSAGRLAVVTRPRGGDWLELDLRELRREGFDTLVSALTAPEEAELELALEGAVAAEVGLRYESLAIPDRDIPLPGSIEPQLAVLASALRGGAAIAVHCRMGIGRSPLIAASVLRHLGLGMEDAFARIGAARGLPVPDTEEQRRWVARLAL